jgi:sugar phosphate isomerase/epimerase
LRHVNEVDCWAAMRAIGAESVEATISEGRSFPRLFHPTRKYSAATPEDLATLQADMQAAGCRITAFSMHNQFDVRPEREIEWTAKAAQAARALGVPAIRIDVVTRKADLPNFLQFSIETLKKVLAASESTGMLFGVENHGKTTNNPEFLKALFAGVGSDRLGLTLDTGNFYWFGHPLSRVYALYEEFAPRVFHTHCRSIRYPVDQRNTPRPMGWKYGEFNCPIDRGDIDFRRLVRLLRDAGYTNDLCIEDESLGKLPETERAATLAKEIQHLERCLSEV